jgi:hypothetical protein
LGNVGCSPLKRELLLSMKLLMCECFPVRMQARDGPQIELAQ